MISYNKLKNNFNNFKIFNKKNKKNLKTFRAKFKNILTNWTT